MHKLLFFTALFIVASCKPEKDVMEAPIKIAGAQLDTKVLREYLPIEYQQNKKVVYVSQNADTLLLDTYWKNNLVARIEGAESYTSEDFNVIFYTPQLPKFRIVVTGTANFSQNKIIRSISVVYESDEPAPIVFFRTFDGDGNLTVNAFSPAPETLTLNGKTFKDCFSSYSENSYSNVETKAIVYLNSAEGVPAFVDKDGNTYVFHGFQ